MGKTQTFCGHATTIVWVLFSPKIKTPNTFNNVAPTYAFGTKNTGPLRLIRKKLIESAIVLEINDAEWQRVMDVDLNAAIWLSRMVLPQMINHGWGRIISFSGMNAQRGFPGASPVAVAKHAVWGLTKSLAAEFGPLGITANIISPGTFPGDDPANAQEPKFVKLLNENPTRRLGTSDDIGAMVSYLCSKNGGFVNGQMLQINGGVVTQF